ncbi:MAG TPA: ATP-dependent Clp protease adaptor ClpS [Bacteroidetes bacterium]|nr:ATP-dependent Clp protease adaptor ClpS [Bacteroidota bacterium]
MASTAPDTTKKKKKRSRVIHIPRYHVILHDDDDHTYEYVIEMLMDIFHHSAEKAYQMAVEVDTKSRVIVDTTSKERAELKRDQIHAYGADWRIPHCKGSMSASIEPAE